MSALIIYNGPIYTMDPAQPQVQAIGIRDGRVAALGAVGKVRAALGQTDALDLRGRPLIPALTDAHVHLIWHALARQTVRLDGLTEFSAVLDRIAAAHAALPPGAWLQGGGWDHTLWGGRWPTAADLDRVAPDRPVLLSRKDGHSAWINHTTIALAAIDDTTPDPPGGAIGRDAGLPNGLLYENAIGLVRRLIPAETAEERLDAVRAACAEAHSYGMVGVHIPAGIRPRDGGLALEVAQTLRTRGELGLRCLVYVGLDEFEGALALGMRGGFGDSMVRFGGLKLFIDGTLGSETAELLTPYAGSKTNTGLPTLDDATLYDAIRRASTAGIPVMTHAIGDRAARRVLDAIEESLPHAAPLALPHRIEHCQLLDEADFARFAALGVVASVQPVHQVADAPTADRLWGKRCARAYAWRTLRDAGATLAFGSDAPVEALDPWPGIHAAVNRCAPGETTPWYPAQKLSVFEAIHGFTTGAAQVGGVAHEQGRIALGYQADFAVLSRDPFTTAPGQLYDTRAELTMLGGQIVYERK